MGLKGNGAARSILSDNAVSEQPNRVYFKNPENWKEWIDFTPEGDFYRMQWKNVEEKKKED